MSRAPSTVSNSACSPAAWPSVRGRPRRCAHRPFPSITHAMCVGMRARSRSAATVARVVEPSAVTRATYILQPDERPTPFGGTTWGVERLRRLPIVRSFLPVHERVSAVGGGPLASSIALGGFVSLFPLLLVGVAVLGFVSAGDTDFPSRVVEQLGLEGRAADQVVEIIDTAEQSRRAASVVGLIGLVWAGLGVAGALENALNATWQVQGRGITSRLVAVAWLV